MFLRLKKLWYSVKTVLPTMLVFATVLVALSLLSCIPWKFTYLAFGKLVIGLPNWVFAFLDLFVLALFAVPIGVVSIVISKRLKIKRVFLQVLGALMLGLVISFSFVFLFSLVFLPRVSYSGSKIDSFVSENAGLGFEDYVSKINSSFLEKNLGKAYGKPEANLQVERSTDGTLLDHYIMQIWGVTRTDVIVYQGWGSCGEAALVIGELLERAGYQTRQCFLKGVDHQWAEANYHGTWLIVDPWYITGNGTLTQAKDVKNFNTDFQNASGVEVQYYNGTWADASQEHGY